MTTETIKVAGKTPYEFACDWYQPSQIALSMARMQANGDARANIPSPSNPAFAEWLAEEYRLAMRKGIELGWNARKDLDKSD